MRRPGARHEASDGAAKGTKHRRPRRWLPGFRPAGEQAPLAELVRRYLHAYGPATPQHFAQWLAAPRRWAAELFDSLSGQIQPVEVDGTLAWVNAGDAAPAASGALGGVRLLPYFDAYVVGSHPRERVFPGQAAERALAGGQAGNFPVLLVDGVVAGVWRQRRAGKKLDLTVEPFSPLSPARQQELEAQARRVGEILEAEARLSTGPVTAGPHA